ncbi:thioredoxin [Polymorphobacter fuscus]|uniref:Thioredoxin n=1 Tax=Sandarakinorhabdus fusca TaxID=1439888 RepID=A0A7C9GUX2_9SPHN|nr:thioredoxin [Polymorphobacter fuscus]KAB7647678.1 thioredoxin [Polymorphobacter fuscus]MQT16969.1 thioredoxin [Polymorphobacter fuscus]NJC09041.1 putative thioredoxin [Polymorphobacter fuscus]
MASLATAATEKASIEAFRQDAIEASRDALVLVDFWAEWCGPCKTLTPLLEKVTAAHAPRVKLVKIDVDKNQTLASQFRIQSIPTVYAFLDGQPVDGFQGALGERELNAFIDRLLAAAPLPAGEADAEAEIAALIAAAEGASAAGNHADALTMFGALAAELPDRESLAAKYALALIAAGDAPAAAAALAAVPADSKDAEVIRARAAVALASEAVPVDDLAALQAAVAAAPDDHAVRFELAAGLIARGDNDAAADALLAIVTADRSWNEGAAQAKLLKMFEAVGLGDPWSIKVRARLRSILFA